MAKLIKKGDLELGDISPDTGFAELSTSQRAPIIARETNEAKMQAQRIIERAEQEARAAVEQAEAQAQQILADAQAEALRLREQAKTEGYREGKNEGAEELALVVSQASVRLQKIEAQVVPQLKELAVSIARKILGKELEFHPESMVNMVKQALADKARQRREVVLRVNPEDLQQLREQQQDLLEVLSRAKEIGIREDPDVERHGVVIETDAGTIDAQLSTQLSVFERVLRDAK